MENIYKLNIRIYHTALKSKKYLFWMIFGFIAIVTLISSKFFDEINYKEILLILSSHVISTSLIIALMNLIQFDVNQELQSTQDQLVEEKFTKAILDKLSENRERYEGLIKLLDYDDYEHPRVKDRYKGITKIHSTLDMDYIKRVYDGSSEVSIMNVWLPRWDDLEPLLRSAVNHGNSVKLLIASEKSDYVRARNIYLADNVRARIQSTCRSVKEFYNDTDDERRNLLEVRFFEGAPACSFYMFGSFRFVGLFGFKRLAVNGVTLEFMDNSDFDTHLKDEFHEVWKNSGSNIDIRKPVSEWGNVGI